MIASNETIHSCPAMLDISIIRFENSAAMMVLHGAVSRSVIALLSATAIEPESAVPTVALKGTETRMRPVTCWFVWGDSSVR